MIKILSEIFQTKKTFKHFYLFANNKNNNNLISSKLTDDYLSEDSIAIYFNRGIPLKECEKAKQQKNRWIFFRCMGNKQYYGNHFANLDILKKYHFDKYYFIPDIIDHRYSTYKRRFDTQINNSPYSIETMDYLYKNDIDIKNLNHLSIFEGDEMKHIKKTYPNISQKIGNLSSGLWIYIYLKSQYPQSNFTLVNYSAEITPKYHSPEFEKGYLLSEILNNPKCHSILTLENLTSWNRS